MTVRSPGPAAPTGSAIAALNPLAQITLHEAGFLGRWQRVNAETTIPRCVDNLYTAGSLNNLRSVRDRSIELTPPRFSDSDLYKTLEACGWAAGTPYPAKLNGFLDEALALLHAAQEPDGYLNSWVQRGDRTRFADLSHGHEMYCAGHLIQAGIGYARATGDGRLLDIGVKFADLLYTVFGPEGRAGVPGHPEIETALVELYRATGEQRYLTLAGLFVDRRGHRTLDTSVTPSEYFQDHLPLRENRHIVGHAVRATYLAAGATDVAVETGDAELLASMQALWTEMVETRMYPSGGIGSRHHGEAFGDAYELPPEQAYAETCAAIASFMWSWRLLLATGDSRYAEVMERTLYNGIACSISRSGAEFFYVNPLQLRSSEFRAAGTQGARVPWFGCACCPPNVARLVASLGSYLATGDADGVQLHLYAAGSLRVGDSIGLAVRSGYPWDGTVHIAVTETIADWALSLRIPQWSAATRITVNGTGVRVERNEHGYAVLRRTWQVGDTVTVEFDLAPRIVRPDERVDAARGCATVERGPLLYCLEEIDQPAGVFEDLRLDPAGPITAVPAHPDLLEGTVALRAAGSRAGVPVELTAIPYQQWANRGDAAMRVWIPLKGESS